MSLANLAHNMDLEWLREAYRLTRKNGAPGIDGCTAQEYAEQLDGNLRNLLERLKAGRYVAPPVRRVHIPKGKGETRPIGIPTFEDRVLQRAVSMLLESVYEQEFFDGSYGFRPGRSAHGALGSARSTVMSWGGAWVLEVDLRKFFDTLEHRRLREILAARVRDKVVTRLIGKWLKAGVVEGQRLTHPEAGTPQGGVISPLLANVYLHGVLDKWFVQAVQPRMRGRTSLVRYADDFVMLFEHEADARQVLGVLPKRLGKYGLRVHPDKTRLMSFRPPLARPEKAPRPKEPRGFDFLGFNFRWERSRRGYWVVKQRTAGKSMARALKAIATWCRFNRHQPLPWQREQLIRKLRGHCAYFGITGNSEALQRFRNQLLWIWAKWRSRTSQRRVKARRRFFAFLDANPFPYATAIRSVLRVANA